MITHKSQHDRFECNMYENFYRDTMYQCQADIRRNEPEERTGK